MFIFNHKLKNMDLLNSAEALPGTVWTGQVRSRLSFAATNTSWVWCETNKKKICEKAPHAY